MPKPCWSLLGFDGGGWDVAGAGFFDFGVVGAGPGEEGLDGGEQGLAEGSESVFNFWRDGWIDPAGEVAVAFERAQSLGEHALGDIADGALEGGKAKGAVGEREQDEEAPLVADTIENIAHGAFCGLVGIGIYGE